MLAFVFRHRYGDRSGVRLRLDRRTIFAIRVSVVVYHSHVGLHGIWVLEGKVV